MKLISKNSFSKLAMASFLAIALVLVSTPASVNAAEDITIASAKITSSTNVVVTLANPGSNLASVNAAKWHIDVNGGGTNPLTPVSATVTSAGTPWTATLTFAAGTFAATDASYMAASGLYADASAVTDVSGDTNAVILHSSSIAVADGQAPTFTSERTGLNTFVLTFSEDVTSGGVDADSFTVSGATTVSAGTVVDGKKITLTTTGLTNMSSAYEIKYVAEKGDVTDKAGNEMADGSNSKKEESKDKAPATPAVPANEAKPADCTEGVLFSPSTGRNCNAAAPAIPAGCTATTSFSPLNGQKCHHMGTNNGNGYAWGTATVRMGSKGEACKAWQMFLNDKAKAGLVLDGACGPKTMAAAVAWQTSAGLTADGALGPMSRAKAMMQ